jgi:hypothetical protein
MNYVARFFMNKHDYSGCTIADLERTRKVIEQEMCDNALPCEVLTLEHIRKIRVLALREEWNDMCRLIAYKRGVR